jgi:hypothetical protein
VLGKVKSRWGRQVGRLGEVMYLSLILQEGHSAHNQEKIRLALEVSARVAQEAALEA